MIQAVLTCTNEFFFAGPHSSQRPLDLAPDLLLERLHLFLKSRVLSGCLARGLLLLLLRLGTLASGAVLVARGLRPALSRLLLRGALLVLAIGALFAGAALARTVLRGASRLALGLTLVLGLSLSALLLPLNLLLRSQVLLIVAVLGRVALTVLHWRE